MEPEVKLDARDGGGMSEMEREVKSDERDGG